MNRNEDQVAAVAAVAAAAAAAAEAAADDGGGLVGHLLSIEVARTFAAVHLNC